jgi:hypothetical protein
MKTMLKDKMLRLNETLSPLRDLFAKEKRDILPPTVKVTGTGFADSAELADWVEKEKFVNLRNMSVMIPTGLKVPYREYIKDLESVWAALENIDTDLLKPLSTALGALANNENSMSTPISFKRKDIKAKLLDIKAEDYVAILARNFHRSQDSSAKLSTMFSNAQDIDGVVVHVKGLNEQIDTVSRKDVNRLIDSIAEATAEIADFETINSISATALSDVLYDAAKWVELFGTFMLQAKSLHESVVSVTVKIQALKEQR